MANRRQSRRFAAHSSLVALRQRAYNGLIEALRFDAIGYGHLPSLLKENNVDSQQIAALQNLRKVLRADNDPAAVVKTAARQCLPLIASTLGLLCLRHQSDSGETVSVYRYQLLSDGQEREVSEARLPLVMNPEDASALERLNDKQLFRSPRLPASLKEATADEGAFLCLHFRNLGQYWATLFLRLPAWASQDDIDVLQQRLAPIENVCHRLRKILETREWSGPDYASALEALIQDKGPKATGGTPKKDDQVNAIVPAVTPAPEQNADSSKRQNGLEFDEQERFRALSRLIKDGLLEADSNWQAIYCNQPLQDITEASEQSLLGSGWLNLLPSGTAGTILTDLRSALVNGHDYQTILQLDVASRTECWVDLAATPLQSGDGEFNGFLVTFRDISAQRRAEQRLQQLVDRDDLTGLSSRRSAEYKLRDLLADTERKRSVALFFIDLDNFKRINDTLGHDVGDEVLKIAAKRLMHSMREEDTVSRFGGDEFVIIMNDVDSLTASQRAENILVELKKPFNVFNQEMFLSGSIGISLSSSRGAKSVTTLMKQADVALYRAKDAGRNNYQFYTEAISRSLNERLLLGNSLHRALEKQEFRVVYQIIADVKTHAVQGVEALLRWHHPQMGPINPEEFIPLLEETGLINSVSDWLIKNAIHQTALWIKGKQLPESAKLSINVSPKQLREPEFPERLKELLDQFELCGHNLVVELTETVLFKDAKSVKNQLLKLRQFDIQIAVDDFGTGYSSLTYLKRFPINIIKLDRSFVQDLKTDQDDEAIAYAVIALGKSLDLQVVAEGVEDAETLARLEARGCDSYQGHLLNQAAEASGITFEHPLIPVDEPTDIEREIEQP